VIGRRGTGRTRRGRFGRSSFRHLFALALFFGLQLLVHFALPFLKRIRIFAHENPFRDQQMRLAAACEAVATLAFFSRDMRTRTTFRTSLFPGLLLGLFRFGLCRFRGTESLEARFIRQFDGALWVNAVTRV
jgi:hypothetical protein